jgi:peroxiredoxin
MNLRNCFKHFALPFFLLAALSGCTGDNFPALQVGVQAPAFTATSLDGKTRSISDYQGKGLLMIFMSSWCPCSNESIPIVNKAYQRHKKDNIEFLIVGIQEARSKFERFVSKQGILFPAIYDDDKLISRPYGINAPPTMVFIGKDGIVKRVFYGNIKDKKKEFVQWLEEIV